MVERRPKQMGKENRKMIEKLGKEVLVHMSEE